MQPIMAHRQQEKDGMPYSEEIAKRLNGLRRHTVRMDADLSHGNSVEIILTGLIWADLFLTVRNRWQKQHRNGLQMVSENILLMQKCHTS